MSRLLAVIGLSLLLLAPTASAKPGPIGDPARTTSFVDGVWRTQIDLWIASNQRGRMTASGFKTRCSRTSDTRFLCFTSARIKDDIARKADRHFDCQGRFSAVYARPLKGLKPSITPTVTRELLDCLAV